VSFETIEHIRPQREFLAEVRRVLAPEGMLLISSPNKAEYTDRRRYENPFHVAELYRGELDELLGRYWSQTVWYGQGVGFCSTIAALHPVEAAGELVGVNPEPGGRHDKSAAETETAREPLYYLVGCANSTAALARLRQPFSVLGDLDDTVYRDYQGNLPHVRRRPPRMYRPYRAREATRRKRNRAAVRSAARLRHRVHPGAPCLPPKRSATRRAAESNDLKSEVDRLRAEFGCTEVVDRAPG
jgi:hypothetical protein